MPFPPLFALFVFVGNVSHELSKVTGRIGSFTTNQNELQN